MYLHMTCRPTLITLVNFRMQLSGGFRFLYSHIYICVCVCVCACVYVCERVWYVRFSCQLQNSIRWMKGAGLVTGEQVEQARIAYTIIHSVIVLRPLMSRVR